MDSSTDSAYSSYSGFTQQESKRRLVDDRRRCFHQLQADIVTLARMADITLVHDIPRAPGKLGTLKWYLKRVANRCIFPAVRPFLWKQVGINRILLSFAGKLAALECRIYELEKRVKEQR